MGHDDCNAWDYEQHPAVATVAEACRTFLAELRDNPECKGAALADTRPFHEAMFGQVVPVACPYIAGHYRGEDFPCLRAYNVVFGGHNGTLPVGVQAAMGFFHEDLQASILELRETMTNPGRPLTPAQQLVRLVQLTAATLTRFLTIHPYANGNGHMARLVVWALLGQFKRLPVQWWLDTSPPAYGPLLTAHRTGNTRPLEVFLLKCIRGN
jgi:fido (protein-threonine AMPylation protein)